MPQPKVDNTTDEQQRHSGEVTEKYGRITMLLREALTLVLAMTVSLAAKLYTAGTTSEKNAFSAVWVSLLIAGALIAVAGFTFLLKQEPSKVFRLKKKIANAYVERLAESLKDRRIPGKA